MALQKPSPGLLPAENYQRFGRAFDAIDTVAADLAAANARLSQNVTDLSNSRALQSDLVAINDRLSRNATDALDLIGQLFRSPVSIDDRPGDTPRNFTSQSANGEPASLLPLSEELISIGDAGREYLARAARYVASRKAMAAEPGRAYRVRWLYRRRGNPADPAGHAVVCKIIFLDARKQQIGEVTVSSRAPLVTDGPIAVSATVGAQIHETVQYAWPAGTAYLRAVWATFGEDGITGLQVMSIVDATDATLLDPVSADVAARVAALEGLPDAVEALEQIVGQPRRLTFSTLAQARAANVPLNVDIMTILGENAPGDGRGGDYSRVGASGPGRLTFTSADGQLWQEVRLTPRYLLGQVMAKMQQGVAVRLACYGDSQTDGTGSTGFSPNPTNGADAMGVIPVGNTNHTDEAPNAWPARLRSILREMYRNPNIQVWNAGYGGQRMANGWALRWYDTAITNNPAYGVPDACFIMFGANDITLIDNTVSPAQFTQAHIDQTRILARKMLAAGTLPILLTGIPIFTTVAAGMNRSSVTLSREINAAKIELARDLGIPCFDTDMPMRRWFEFNDDDRHWGNVQSDGLHGGDPLQAFIACDVARRLFRDIVEIDAAKPARILQLDSRTDYKGGPVFGYLDTAIGGRQGTASVLVNNTPGSSSGFTAGEEVLRAWVWNEAPDASCLYRHHDNDGCVNKDTAAKIVVSDRMSGAILYNDAVPNSGFISSPYKSVDRPGFITQLTYGLNYVSLRAPSDLNAYFRYGWFELAPNWAAGTKFRPGLSANQSFRFARSDANMLRRAGAIFDIAPAGLTNGYLTLDDESIDGSNIMSFGKKGSAVILYLDARIDPGRGLGFLMGRGMGPDYSPRLRVGVLLYRTAANSLALYLYALKLNNDGTLTNELQLLAQGADGSFTATDISQIRVDCICDASGRQTVNVYKAWAGGPAVVSYSVAAGGANPVPVAGYLGDLWTNHMELYAGNSTVHVRSAKTVHG